MDIPFDRTTKRANDQMYERASKRTSERASKCVPGINRLITSRRFDGGKYKDTKTTAAVINRLSLFLFSFLSVALQQRQQQHCNALQVQDARCTMTLRAFTSTDSVGDDDGQNVARNTRRRVIAPCTCADFPANVSNSGSRFLPSACAENSVVCLCSWRMRLRRSSMLLCARYGVASSVIFSDREMKKKLRIRRDVRKKCVECSHGLWFSPLLVECFARPVLLV